MPTERRRRLTSSQVDSKTNAQSPELARTHSTSPAFLELMMNKLTKSLASPKTPHSRKEAIPIPLAVVVRWEETILDTHTAPPLRLLLGFFLLCIASSLRFGDAQRISPHQLSLTAYSLRGECWRTETDTEGQPFAIRRFGITGRTNRSAWILPWLQDLAQALAQQQATARPDFLLPTLPDLEQQGPVTYTCPMSYTQALARLRWAIQTPWKEGITTITVPEAVTYTMHSLKVTYLAAAAQLRLPQESRRLQGHHKQDSVQLYSRDDTIEGLRVQDQSPHFRCHPHPC